MIFRAKKEPPEHVVESNHAVEYDEDKDDGKEWGFNKIVLFIFFVIGIVLCFDLYLSSYQMSIWDLPEASRIESNVKFLDIIF